MSESSLVFLLIRTNNNQLDLVIYKINIYYWYYSQKDK